jgi:rubrerythrin
MENREELTQLIKEQIKIENDHIKRLDELQKKVDTAAAQLLLTEMRLDSQKHASILGGIIETLKGLPSAKTLWEFRVDSYVDKLAVKKELENHVKMETKVLNHVQEEIKKTKDEGLKLLLEHIAEDEKKHHKILETIVKNSYKINP